MVKRLLIFYYDLDTSSNFQNEYNFLSQVENLGTPEEDLERMWELEGNPQEGYNINVALDKYKPEEHNMFYASTKAQHCYSDVDFSNMDEVFILFGKETKGLPEDLLQKYIENTIRIPMKGELRSLNLSNSVAIIVYEVLRQGKFEDLKEISDYFKA